MLSPVSNISSSLNSDNQLNGSVGPSAEIAGLSAMSGGWLDTMQQHIIMAQQQQQQMVQQEQQMKEQLLILQKQQQLQHQQEQQMIALQQEQQMMALIQSLGGAGAVLQNPSALSFVKQFLESSSLATRQTSSPLTAQVTNPLLQPVNLLAQSQLGGTSSVTPHFLGQLPGTSPITPNLLESSFESQIQGANLWNPQSFLSGITPAVQSASLLPPVTQSNTQSASDLLLSSNLGQINVNSDLVSQLMLPTLSMPGIQTSLDAVTLQAQLGSGGLLGRSAPPGMSNLQQKNSSAVSSILQEQNSINMLTPGAPVKSVTDILRQLMLGSSSDIPAATASPSASSSQIDQSKSLECLKLSKLPCAVSLNSVGEHKEKVRSISQSSSVDQNIRLLSESKAENVNKNQGQSNSDEQLYLSLAQALKFSESEECDKNDSMESEKRSVSVCSSSSSMSLSADAIPFVPGKVKIDNKLEEISALKPSKNATADVESGNLNINDISNKSNHASQRPNEGVFNIFESKNYFPANGFSTESGNNKNMNSKDSWDPEEYSSQSWVLKESMQKTIFEPLNWPSSMLSSVPNASSKVTDAKKVPTIVNNPKESHECKVSVAPICAAQLSASASLTSVVNQATSSHTTVTGQRFLTAKRSLPSRAGGDKNSLNVSQQSVMTTLSVQAISQPRSSAPLTLSARIPPNFTFGRLLPPGKSSIRWNNDFEDSSTEPIVMRGSATNKENGNHSNSKLDDLDNFDDVVKKNAADDSSKKSISNEKPLVQSISHTCDSTNNSTVDHAEEEWQQVRS